jgi:hypothetical protein
MRFIQKYQITSQTRMQGVMVDNLTAFMADESNGLAGISERDFIHRVRAAVKGM